MVKADQVVKLKIKFPVIYKSFLSVQKQKYFIEILLAISMDNFLIATKTVVLVPVLSEFYF